MSLDELAHRVVHSTIGGFEVFFERDADKVKYWIIHMGLTSPERRATFRPCAWTRHLHGNPPSGTQYGAYRVKLPNGRRVSVPVYI